MRKIKTLVCEDVRQLWPVLTNILLFDPVQYGGAIYDINPFGGWVLNPAPMVFGGPFYRMAIPLPSWPTPEAFDLALVQLLTKVAKSRLSGIVKVHTKSALPLLAYGISLKQIVLHPRTLAKVKPEKATRVWATEHMQPNIIIGLEHPEEVGRVCGQGIHSLGAFIFDPAKVAGVHLVANYPEAPQIRFIR